MKTKLKDKEIKSAVAFVSKFKEITEKGDWVSNYDIDSDSLVIRKPKLSKDVNKRYINKEFALYLNKRSGVEGVFIEYFNSNLVEHHKKELAPIKIALQEKRKDSLIELKKRDTKRIITGLEPVLLHSMISNSAENCS